MHLRKGRDMLNKYIPTLLLSLLALLMPAKDIMITVIALITADLLFGLAAAIKQKIKITSAGLKVTVLKVLLYEAAIVTSFFVQQYLTGVDIPVMKWIASLIGLVELKSILEKLDILGNGNIFNTIISKIQDSLNVTKPPQE